METSRPVVGRRSVLGALTVATVTAAAGCARKAEPADPVAESPTRPPPGHPPVSTPPSGPAAAPLPPRTLLEATFVESDRFRLVQLVAPGFEDLERPAGETLGAASAPCSHAAPFVAMELTLVDPGRRVRLGLADRSDTWGLTAAVDPRDGAVRLELAVSGRPVDLGSARLGTLPAGTTIGLVVCENQATVLVRRPGASWSAAVTERDAIASAVDLRRVGALGRCRYQWGPADDDTARPLRHGRVRAGTFGMVGLRDPRLVRFADGTPYERDGRLLMTWTCAGAGFFQQAHLGVFEVDPLEPRGLRLVSHLFSRRDGRVLGDHAGQLLRVDGRWLLLTSSWGDFDGSGVQVRHAWTGDDVLAGVHVLDTEATTLPTRHSSWDPSAVRTDGGWVVSYVVSPSQDPFVFWPAVASTRDATPVESLALVAEDDGVRQAEGPVLARDRKGWHVVTSDADRRAYVVHDLQLREQGTLDAPYGTNIPHAQVVPAVDGSWVLLTFDGTNPFEETLGYGAHGDVVVMRSVR